MKEFNLNFGVSLTEKQRCLLAYAFLKNSGVSMTTFSKRAGDMFGLFPEIKNSGNVMSIRCTVNEPGVADEDQTIRLVMILLGSWNISLGVFQTSVKEEFIPGN